jgi:hypothetical protein
VRPLRGLASLSRVSQLNAGVRQTSGRPMALYELVVERPAATADTIREIRKKSPLGIADIRRRIAERRAVLTVSTTDHAPEIDMIEGRRGQHATFLAVHEALVQLGNVVTIRYKPSVDSAGEVVDLTIAKNLMNSELQDLRQAHD